MFKLCPLKHPVFVANKMLNYLLHCTVQAIRKMFTHSLTTRMLLSTGDFAVPNAVV